MTFVAYFVSYSYLELQANPTLVVLVYVYGCLLSS